MKSMKLILKVAGKLTGGLAFANNAIILYNKGRNATSADYIKAGISLGLVFAESNPYVFVYNVADLAGYNIIDIITHTK